jgi:hypothetical protein
MTKQTAAQKRQAAHEAWLAAHPEQRITVTITVGRETRTVQARTFSNLEEANRVSVVDQVVATIGAGVARYPEFLYLSRLREGDRQRPGTTKVTDTDGRTWTYHMGTCVRNRQARIVGWADTAGITNYHDQERTS